MQAALIAALATVVVALLGAFNSRLESRDARARLIKDLEISSKLATGSPAWQAMDSHINSVAETLVYRERRREDHRDGRRMVYFGIFSAFVTLGLSILREHALDYYRPLLFASYWMFFTYMFLFPVVGLILVLRVERQRRQRPAEQTTEAEPGQTAEPEQTD
jgi:Flp pilus assembly protein TadB